MNLSLKFVPFVLCIAAFVAMIAPNALAQSRLPEPYQEKLLNGLKVLVWNDATADKITVKIRIHSGSAFDPQGREGVMRMLADNFFPNETARDFFREDLAGSLEIKSTYDYIEIDAVSKPEGLLTVLETLATAISNPTIDKETTAKLKTAQIAKLKSLEADPAYVADRAVAKRLFGTFPYGRPELGTLDSLQKIDFVDLLDAKKRFVTADNATLAITGKVDLSLAMRAIRRYFGPWLKSDKLVPSTFKQPDAPDTKELKIEIPNVGKYVVRSAEVAPARGDKDYFVMQVLVKIWRNQSRFGESNESDCGKSYYQANLLRGVYGINADRPGVHASINIENICGLPSRNADGGYSYPEIKQADFDEAKAKTVSEYYQKVQTTSGLSDLWLDLDTFRLKSVADESRKLNDVTLADVNALAERLRKSPTVRVLGTAAFTPD